MAATEKRLGELHRQLTETLMKAIVDIEEKEYDEDGEVKSVRVVRPSAGTLAVAAAFLKHNSISADIDGDENTAELKRRLESRGRISSADMKDALASVGKSLIQ